MTPAFKAHCSLVEQKPTSTCTPEEFATAAAAGVESRWDRTLKTEILAVECSETFEGLDDRARFEDHMRSQHPKRIKIWEPGGLSPTYGKAPLANYTPRLQIKPTKAVRLPKNGKALAKAAADQLRACPSCGLHGQVDGVAGNLWWDEHLRGCALAAAS